MAAIEPGDKIEIKYSDKHPPFPAVALTFREAQKITQIDQSQFPDVATAFDAMEAYLKNTPGLEDNDIQELLDRASKRQVEHVLQALSGSLTEDEEKKSVSLRS